MTQQEAEFRANERFRATGVPQVIYRDLMDDTHRVVSKGSDAEAFVDLGDHEKVMTVDAVQDGLF